MGRTTLCIASACCLVFDGWTSCRADDTIVPATISKAKIDHSGLLIHDVTSSYQGGTTQIRVLLPDRIEPNRRYPVIFVLPVEAGRESRYGDGLAEIKKRDLHNKLQAIFVAPTFSHLPWYADHPSNPAIRQESYLLDVVLPFIAMTYPVQGGTAGRMLLGFSKSGWGAFSLLLRHPEVFGAAAAWDAPLMMDRPGRYGSGDIFGTPENFERYRVSRLLEARREPLQKQKRLILLGYGNFRDQHEQAHALMTRLGILHDYRTGPARKHDWHSGWVAEAAELLIAASGRGTMAASWPQFRGPTGQGHSAGRLPLEWSATRNVVWKQALPGLGWSSPVVQDGRIFLTTAIPASGGDQSLRALALDAGSGKILWERELFHQAAGAVEALHDRASHANSTPITDGRHVYVHFGAQGTAALDRDGNVLWRKADLRYRQWHGNGGSPVLFEDLLIFNCDGADVQYIVALDRATGSVVWKTQRKVDVERRYSYCTPLVIEVDGRLQLISPAAGAVIAYEPRSGKELWRVGLDDGYSNVPRPVFGQGLLFLSNSTDSPHLLAIRPDGAGDVTASHIVWRMRRAVPLTSSPLLLGDELYMVSDRGVASCMDAKTGNLHWRERLGAHHYASPVDAEGRVYFQGEDGVATVIKAGPRFEVLARNSLEERVMASYAALDGVLFIRAEKHLYRIEAP